MSPGRASGLAGSVAFVLCVLASVLLLAPARSARIPDGQNVFNGYAMGGPLSRYPALQKVKSWTTEFVKEVGLYENPGEETVLNGVSFGKARYRFADGQLESIDLTYTGRENRDKLMRWLEERYGKLIPAERKMVTQVEWHGDVMAITLSYNHAANKGTLFVASPELHHRIHKSIASMTD
ncbi:MAG: hypothetical protein EPO02_12575 [Nitrospirae bacterium]|nr:MAG: hypothetical protein EPO02_12575 [Nitrospirota bacterium]